jgi:hypothetical protein
VEKRAHLDYAEVVDLPKLVKCLIELSIVKRSTHLVTLAGHRRKGQRENLAHALQRIKLCPKTIGDEVLGMGKAVSDGVIRGIVTNIDKTVNAIQKAVNEASDMAEVAIGEVIVGIAGQHIRSSIHHGVIIRNTKDDEITVEDVRRLSNDMENIVVPPGNTIIIQLRRSVHVRRRHRIPMHRHNRNTRPLTNR